MQRPEVTSNKLNEIVFYATVFARPLVRGYICVCVINISQTHNTCRYGIFSPIYYTILTKSCACIFIALNSVYGWAFLYVFFLHYSKCVSLRFAHLKWCSQRMSCCGCNFSRSKWKEKCDFELLLRSYSRLESVCVCPRILEFVLRFYSTLFLYCWTYANETLQIFATEWNWVFLTQNFFVWCEYTTINYNSVKFRTNGDVSLTLNLVNTALEVRMVWTNLAAGRAVMRFQNSILFFLQKPF